ncbi:flagellar biosynthesis protein FlhF [Brevibacillus humidisoli]|uniref:flagellar biosynthesis protein FlhF n=1 Tax=Brevibacillus humidisoli TaxID=2895522 RepID=UPI001E4EFFF6|nr:flagellar biosynthesis protein FlhF [Brevibacillus humidisoli]UFJ42142.1 flagellar biosynthesis protein FlhF [Brevibacillus humidisoli]
MRVKRYLVDSMPDALEKIRLDLGKDAIILNTKQVRTGGFLGMFRKQQIEVIAAVDAKQGSSREQADRPADRRSPSPLASFAARQAYKQNGGSLDANDQISVPAAGPMVTTAEPEKASTAVKLSESSAPADQDHRQKQPSELPARSARIRELATVEKSGREGTDAPSSNQDEYLAGELRDIRDMFSKLLLKDDGRENLPQSFVPIRDRLLAQEVDPAIVSSLIKDLLRRWDQPEQANEQDVRAAARQLLIELVKRKAPLTPTVPRSVKYAYFFGPTGVGKTTTIAKLAAECILKEKRKVGFITSDTYRIAAVEQLKTYANILNAPLEVVFSAKEIEQAMERLCDCELILIDTAGRNYRNDEYVQAMKELLRTGEASEHYLVLSLTSRYADMQAIVERFHDLPYAKVIFTKSDETEAYGTMVNVVHNYDLSLSFVTTGQNVPDDLTVATPEWIVDLILGEDSDA